MKINEQTGVEVLATDELDGLEYGIDPENFHMAIQAMYQYSDPIGSIVREITSNCFDSHAEARRIPTMTDDELAAMGYATDPVLLRAHFQAWKERPIEVEIIEGNRYTNSQSRIIFRDFGVGLSPDRVKRVFTKFFSSTKRASNDFIGAFGLGSKSPLGYTEMFDVVTRWMGTEYHYTIHRGQKAPRIELLLKEVTTEPNGSEVIVPVKDNDTYRFRKAVKEHLAYFDGIKFIGCGTDIQGTIYRGEHFVYHSGKPFTQMHLALGKVYYPLNMQVVYPPNDARSVPIGLRFEIGDIPVVWNRENVEYTDEARVKIAEKIKLAEVELQEIADGLNAEIRDIKTYLQHHWVSKKNSIPLADGVVLETNSWIQRKLKYPKYEEGEDAIKLPFDPLATWEVHRQVQHGQISSKKILPNLREAINGTDTVYFCRGQLTSRINKYISFVEDETEFYVVRPRGRSERDIKDLFGFQHNNPTPEMLGKIKAYVKEVDHLIAEKFEDYDRVEIPDSWKAPVLSSVTKKKRPEGRIPIKRVKGLYESTPSYSMEDLDLKELSRFKGMVIFDGYAETEYLDSAARLALLNPSFKASDYFGNIKILKVAKTNMSLIKEARPDAIRAKKLILKRFGGIVRSLTALHLEEWFTVNLPSVWSQPELVRKFDETLYSIVQRLKAYHKASITGNLPTWQQKNIVQQLGAYLEQSGGLDGKALADLQIVQDFLLKYPLLSGLNLIKVTREEIEPYLRAMGSVRPALLRRLRDWKEMKAALAEEARELLEKRKKAESEDVKLAA